MEKQTSIKPKVLFVYDMPPEKEANWRDGLWAALNLLESNFNIIRRNLYNIEYSFHDHEQFDFVLGWGGFNSLVDKNVKTMPWKKGLCLGGYGFPARGIENYDVIFYETEWSKKWIKENSDSPNIPRLIHAFGINADIFWKNSGYDYLKDKEIWDYVSVGAFSSWKRQEKIIDKSGSRLVIGEIQKGNLHESMDIVHNLLLNGVMVSPEASPEILVKMYCSTKKVYIPATTLGGGERAVLEARACGCDVEVELDNPKLQELLVSPIWNHKYYAEQLQKGIYEALSR